MSDPQPPALRTGTDLPAGRPVIRLLPRPLDIVPRGKPGDAELGAVLAPADQPDAVAAAVHAPAAEFDPDAAFRALDDVRTRAERLVHWVEEGLARGVPRRPRDSIWILVWWVVLSVAGAAAVLAAPGWVLLPVAKWTLWLAVAGTVLGLLLAGGARVWMAAALACVAIYVLRLDLGSVGLSRFFMIAAAVGLAFLLVSLLMLPDSTARFPTEYVLREGEAERHAVDLCLVGDDAVLAVTVRSFDGAGRVLRHVVLPVERANRADADAMVWVTRAHDRESARIRGEKEAAQRASADALRRVEELERSRRRLPEG